MLLYKSYEEPSINYQEIKVSTNPEMRTIGFMCIASKKGNYYTARTGPIHCKNGFTVEVKLIRGRNDDDNWE